MAQYQGARRRFKEMYSGEWYDNYLMRYVKLLERPHINPKKRQRLTEKLLEWYENTQFSYMEDYVVER